MDELISYDDNSRIFRMEDNNIIFNHEEKLNLNELNIIYPNTIIFSDVTNIDTNGMCEIYINPIYYEKKYEVCIYTNLSFSAFLKHLDLSRCIILYEDKISYLLICRKGIQAQLVQINKMMIDKMSHTNGNIDYVKELFKC